MFKFDEQCDPKQVSLTGVRAIVLLSLLSIKPRTFEEIKKFFVSSNLVEREYSVDTIRIDINTLKYVGCEISRADKRTDNHYVLLSHPFELILSEEEIITIEKIYKGICKSLSIERLLEYDNLFEKLSDVVKEKELKERLRGISIFKNLNKDLIKEILSDCKKNTRITILYIVDGVREHEYDLTLDNLGIRSNKLYLYCFNHSMNKRMFLKFSSIKKVLCRNIKKSTMDSLDYCVEFYLKNYKSYDLETQEEIIEEKDGVARIRGAYFSDFIAMQRILYFAKDCVVISPNELREIIITQLRNMRARYD